MGKEGCILFTVHVIPFVRAHEGYVRSGPCSLTCDSLINELRLSYHVLYPIVSGASQA